MAGEFDYEVSRKIWEAAVPVEFQVEGENRSGETCRPCYAMLPRCSYFPLHLPQILEQIRAREDSIKLEADKVWLECIGTPLKLYYPIGVLFDLHRCSDSPKMTVTIKYGTRPESVSYVSKDTMEAMFLQSLKEANYLKRRKDEIVSTMKIDEHKQLWSGLVQDQFDDFWNINRRLMESSEERPFHSIPIRFYISGHPFRQIPQPPVDESGEHRLLSSCLSSLSADFVEMGAYKFISHGITLPLDTPLSYMGKNLAYPDNFVHICAVYNSNS